MAERVLSEREKMLSGALYNSLDPELVEGRLKARQFMETYNKLVVPTEDVLKKRTEMLKAQLGTASEGIFIEPPFFCDYGSNIHIGRNTYMNFNCTILDCARIEIGSEVMFGPGVQIYAAHHPLQASERVKGPELASPIKIGNRCWIGGSAIILPGVEIGENTTIGAGSVVTHNIPANCVAVGSPARVIRQLAP